MSKIQQAKKLLNSLNKLDAQYLTSYPANLPRTTYLKKRKALGKRIQALKK